MAHVVIGTGSYLPERVVTNQDLEKTVLDFDRARAKAGSLDEWARRQHGGISRHVIGATEYTSDMATHAAKRAIADAGIGNKDIQLIVMATFSNDYRLPQAAGVLQANLESKAKFIQIDSACTGFIDAMFVAPALMQAHGYETALVVGADAMSYYTDPDKFMPSTVFGDGAGAVVLQRRDDLKGCGVGAFSAGSDGDIGDYAWAPGGISNLPLKSETLDRGPYIKYKFSLIYPWAIDRMSRGAREAIERSGITLGDVRWVIPHQASMNLIRDVGRRLEVPEEKMVVTYPHTGNTSAASIPIALDEGNRRGLFSEGDWLVLPAAGAGMAWAAMTYRWHDYRAARARTA